MNNQTENRVSNKDEPLDIKKIISRLLYNWYWILFSLIICVTISVLYARYKTPSYKISARVLVNDEKKGSGLMAGSDILGDLGGLLGAKSTVIMKLRS